MNFANFALILPFLLMTIIGFLFRKYPPKNINGIYGYRTSRSKKNQESWDLAQAFSSNLLFNWSLGATIGMALQYFINPAQSATQSAYTFAIVIVLLVFGIVHFTEKELKNKFP